MKPVASIIIAITLLAALTAFWSFRAQDESVEPLVFQMPSPSVSPEWESGLSWQFLPPLQDKGLIPLEPSPTSLVPEPSPLQSFAPPPAPRPTPGTAELLALPLIPEAELNIGPGGASNLAGYLDLFIEHTGEIKFELKKFERVRHRPEGIIYLPAELVELGLQGGDFSSVSESLAIFKEFLLSKIDYLKSLRVSGAAVKLNSYMIGIDLLTAELIDKVFSVRSGGLALPELKTHYQKYQNTVSDYQEQFKRGSLVSLEGGDALKKLFRFLRLKIQSALAQGGSPFGGFITAVDECSCLGGYIMFLSPGFIGPAPGSYTMFISYATASSPLLFLYKRATPGHWILGNYAPAGGVCLTGRLCSPSAPFIGIVKLAGTS